MRKALTRNLTSELQRRLPAASKAQVRNLALLTQALIFSKNCHLASWALELPIAGQRESLMQRLTRFLDNCHVTRETHYLPLVRDLFSHWPDREVNLVMDRTDLGRRWSILLLAAAFQHRALPLTWRWLPFGGTSEKLHCTLLQEIASYLPTTARITFLGDSEFRAVGLQQYCRDQQWHWQVGVKSDTLFHTGDEAWQALRTLTVKRQHRRYVHQVTLTQQRAFPEVHLIVDGTRKWETPHYFACDQPTDGHSWRRGRKRFWIEPTFRDWKSYGFDLEASHLTLARRYDRLLLAMNIATLWLLHLGQWLHATGRRAWLEAPHRRDYSCFRLARDYLLRAQTGVWEMPPIRLHR
jgi:hypothetical protein